MKTIQILTLFIFLILFLKISFATVLKERKNPKNSNVTKTTKNRVDESIEIRKEKRKAQLLQRRKDGPLAHKNYLNFKLYEFKKAQNKDIRNISERFNNCEFKENFIEQIKSGDGDIKILLYKNEIIAITDLYQTKVKNLYYIDSLCTSDKSLLHLDFKQPGARQTIGSPGRIAWSYILFHTNILNQNEPFIIYTHAIPSAYLYYIKMGMEQASRIRIDFKSLFKKHADLNTAELPEAEFNLIDAKLDRPMRLLDSFDNTYLFYRSKKIIDYRFLNLIFNSLPQSKEPTHFFKNDKKSNLSKKAGFTERDKGILLLLKKKK